VGDGIENSKFRHHLAGTLQGRETFTGDVIIKRWTFQTPVTPSSWVRKGGSQHSPVNARKVGVLIHFVAGGPEQARAGSGPKIGSGFPTG